MSLDLALTLALAYAAAVLVFTVAWLRRFVDRTPGMARDRAVFALVCVSVYFCMLAGYWTVSLYLYLHAKRMERDIVSGRRRT